VLVTSYVPDCTINNSTSAHFSFSVIPSEGTVHLLAVIPSEAVLQAERGISRSTMTAAVIRSAPHRCTQDPSQAQDDALK